ncbi:PilN domain-containing protein [Legionella sp.]|uniref:PilN domain-containing protein n=1 Tax=Legionella sp. TaxID=459 RepID=UPI0032208622
MLIEINLLPWRQFRRNRERRNLLAVAMAIFILIIFAFLLIHSHIKKLNDSKEKCIKDIERKITYLNKKINEIKKIKMKKEGIIKRILFKKKLDEEGYLVVNFFGEITKIIPHGIYLNQMQFKNNKVVLQGVSEFNDLIASMIKNIKQNPWMKDPSLLEVKKIDGLNKAQFNLSFALVFKEKWKPNEKHQF